MVHTSWSWPNLFDVARGQVNLYSDAQSIVNRVKLLMLTDPTELHMYPDFGLGLRKYMFTYNNDNTIAMIRDNLIDQLRKWEPAVIPEDTKVTRGLSYTGDSDPSVEQVADINRLQLTVTLRTTWMREINFTVTEEDLDRLP